MFCTYSPTLGRAPQTPVSIDLAHGRLELGSVPPRRDPVVATSTVGAQVLDLSKGRRRLGIQMRLSGEADLCVERVLPESLAQSSGLRAGDVLRRVNGRALSSSDTSGLSDVLATTAGFEIEVRRGQDTDTIKVPATAE